VDGRSGLADPREHLAAVSDGEYVYTVGGRFLSADKNSAAFERFDSESGEWVKLVDMPTPRGSYGAAFIDGRIVVVGGEEPARVLSAVERYDIADGKWTTLAPIATPVTARWSPRSATPFTASAARIGPHTKVLSRRSRPWTCPNA
jgi:hypothetical protein